MSTDEQRPDNTPDETGTVTVPYSLLVDIWLDGFVSGVSTAAGIGGANDAESHEVAMRLGSSVARDPAALEMTRRSINDRITGTNIDRCEVLTVEVVRGREETS